MNKKETNIHEEIADRLLCIMDDVDLATSKIFELRHNHGFDYSDHINKLSAIKSDAKRILNKDFDHLALRKKQ